MRRAIVGIVVAVVVLGVALLVARARDDAAAASIDDRVHAIASELRCPVCQSLSVADSPSRLAGEMRDEIAARLEAGATEDEIRTFFVQRYGAWVLLEPPRSGFDLIPWLVPIVGVIAGVAVWFGFVRRRPRAVEPDGVVEGST